MATFVEGAPKVPFSIVTHRGVREGATPFPGLLYFTLDLYLIMLSVKQGGIKYHFLVFGMNRPGIEPQSLGPLAKFQPEDAGSRITRNTYYNLKLIPSHG